MPSFRHPATPAPGTLAYAGAPQPTRWPAPSHPRVAAAPWQATPANPLPTSPRHPPIPQPPPQSPPQSIAQPWPTVQAWPATPATPGAAPLPPRAQTPSAPGRLLRPLLAPLLHPVFWPLTQLRQRWPAAVRLLPRVGAALLAALLAYALLTPAQLPFAAPADAASPDGPLTVEPMPFEQPGQSFPGSAFYYLAPDPAGASGGTAGTSPLAPDAHWDSAETLTSGPAARPLAQIAAQADRLRALNCLTTAIYYEAATEPDAGQHAVAQVILNRVAHPAFPKTVCGVVYQGSERATGCQFTFTCDGSMARRPMPMFWNRAELVARAALNGYVYAPVGLATHYHTFQVHPYWDDSLNFIGQIGAHRFYRFEGPAGSPDAFATPYRGGEPAPGPHPRSLAASSARDAATDPLALQRAFAAAVKSGQSAATPVLLTVHSAGALPAPAYTSEVLRRGGDATYRASNLPESRTVNPEYQNSGRWLGDPQ